MVEGGLTTPENDHRASNALTPSLPQDSRASVSVEDEIGRRTVCAECGFTADRHYALIWHGDTSGHKPFACRTQGCSFTYLEYRDYRNHVKADHFEQFLCQECQQAFSSKWDIDRHAINTAHAVFVCTHEGCESTFSRYDTFERHQKTHQEDVKRYPCKYCKKHRGSNGFKRKDHLTQHLRKYHHIGERDARIPLFADRVCPHRGCPRFRMYDSFRKHSEYTTHMRKDHDESDFPCPEPGCERVGGKGYFRKRDLVAHQKRVHGVVKDLVAGTESNA